MGTCSDGLLGMCSASPFGTGGLQVLLYSAVGSPRSPDYASRGTTSMGATSPEEFKPGPSSVHQRAQNMLGSNQSKQKQLSVIAIKHTIERIRSVLSVGAIDEDDLVPTYTRSHP